jgi:hypothetical protein
MSPKINAVEKIVPQDVKKILDNANLRTDEGIVAPFDFFDYYQKGFIFSCFGNNSTNPYLTCGMLPAPEQPEKIVDFPPISVNGVLQIQNNINFHLGANEAIVFVGMTPPEVKYFSFTVFLTSRHGEPAANQNMLEIIPIRTRPKRDYQLTPKQELREVLFASLGSPLNNLKISTSVTPQGASGDPCNQSVVIVITANREVQRKIYDTLSRAGYPQEWFNTIVVPSEIARLGVTDVQADMFSVGIRIAGNPDVPPLKEYLEKPPMSVFRVTASNCAVSYFPTPALTPAGTGRTEMAYLKPVEKLRDAIIARYSGYDAIELQTEIWLEEGYTTLQQNIDGMGASRDTPYTATGIFRLPLNSFLIVYGVNHAKTGKCTYANVNIYGSLANNGVVGVSSEDFAGSASKYLDRREDPLAEDLYAWKFTYDKKCTEPYCSVIPRLDPANPTRIPPYVIGMDEPVFVGFRAYLEQSTKVGPAWHELITDRVIVFMPR